DRYGKLENEGVLHDGLVVAIKKFRSSVGFSEARFYDELNLVPKLQHICLAKLVGYCHEVTVSLEWIAMQMVLPLPDYPGDSRQLMLPLHEQRVVHSDLKPSNILLDHNMNPKISDFGIARMLDHGDDLTTIDVSYLAGTMGYMPPEYIAEGILLTKYDVYSFGIVLLEAIGSMCDGKFRRQASVEWVRKTFTRTHAYT
ncbi:Cysteine-rich receptor-like protein kinase 10, partial [Dichanthelium oligosanthes]